MNSSIIILGTTKYEEDAVCVIRKDYISFINELDTRNPEDLKEIMDILKPFGFNNFYKNGIEKISNDTDFWEWCNINTENENFIKND